MDCWMRNEEALKQLEQDFGLLYSMIIIRSPMGNDVDDCLGFCGTVHPPRFAKSLLVPSFSGPHTWLGLDSCRQTAFGVIVNKGLRLRNTL